MLYTKTANAATPALIIYLLDVSASMKEDCGGQPRVDVVSKALGKMIQRLGMRSTKGAEISPRYRIAMFAYSSKVVDLLGGIVPLPELAEKGVPQLYTVDSTDTEAAFLEAERLLKSEIPNLPERSPAPLVCHMTDGEFNGEDPRPVVERIKQLSVPDGNVLVENVYIKEGIVQVPDIGQWPGILSDSEFSDAYAKVLFQMSSPLPDSYRNVIAENGYKLAPGIGMFLPGNEPELVELGCVMSSATPT